MPNLSNINHPCTHATAQEHAHRSCSEHQCTAPYVIGAGAGGAPGGPATGGGQADCTGGLPLLNLSHARECNDINGISEHTAIQDTNNRVNPVNVVIEECEHEFAEEPAGDRIRTGCRRCGKLLGYRPISLASTGQIDAFSGVMEE